MENPVEKQEKSSSPMVSIDGSKIRAIREDKKLTQLYAANVVGVTTDTISRWENNRYPSIKRDNAEKLAAALEVDLPAILKVDEPQPSTTDSITTLERAGGMQIPLLILGIVILLTAAFFALRPATRLTAVRNLPRFGAPGEIVPVRIKVTRTGGERVGFVIRERLPEGWRLVASSPPSAAVIGPAEDIKWLVPAGATAFNVLYTAKIDPNTRLQTSASLKGIVVSRADGSSRTELIGGDGLIRIAGVHWADSNGDCRIDDDEIMPAYYLTEEMKGLGLDWKKVEAIWNAGGYHWDPQKEEFLVK